MKLKIEKREITELKPNPKNPRIHKKENTDKIKDSILEFGFTNPIIIDEYNMILAGHGRFQAGKDAQIKEIPVICMRGLTEAQKQIYTVADNRLGSLSEWDNKKLDEMIKEIDTLLDQNGIDPETLQLTGFSEEELDEFLKDEETAHIEGEDSVPDTPKKKDVVVDQGELWFLGEHRLLCGDSTSTTALEMLMGDEKATLSFNDPPYGMKKEKDGVKNDNLNYDDLLEFNKKWIPLCFSFLKDNGSWYCWGIDEPLMDIYSNILKPYIEKNKATFRNLITWNKKVGQGQLSSEFRSYAIADEKCLFVMMGVQGFNTNSDNYFDKWESVRKYLEIEIKKFNKSDKEIANLLGFKDGRTVNHWHSKSQWAFPTKENYLKLQKLAQSNKVDGFKKEYDELKKDYYSTRAYFDNTHDNMNNVWDFNRTGIEEKKETGGHATPKPIELCERGIKSSSKKGDIVLDLFGGSGSTLIACEKTKRKCFMIELDKRYIEVIIERWQNFTGQIAKNLDGETLDDKRKKRKA